MSDRAAIRVLLVLVAVLVGVIVALITTMLSRSSGSSISVAVLRGGAALGGTITVLVLLINSLGLI